MTASKQPTAALRFARFLASGDRGRFLESEQESRRLQGMPPFGRLAALIVSGEDDRAVRVAAQALGQSAPRGEKVQVLGPAPARPSRLSQGKRAAIPSGSSRLTVAPSAHCTAQLASSWARPLALARNK